MSAYKIAFVGNPNVGKSAWINALSQSHFQVGNWPGVTVEKKEAHVKWDNQSYHLIDLPGCYSLEESNNEEKITSSFLKKERPDVLVNVVDATNLSRNLLLTLYLRELQIPMILIFNFMDEVEKNKIHMDVNKLQRRLQIPIVASSAFDKSQYQKIIQVIIKQVNRNVFYYPLFDQQDLNSYIQLFEGIQAYIPKTLCMDENVIHRLCIRVLEEDHVAIQQLRSWGMGEEVIQGYTCTLSKETIELHRFKLISSLMKYVQQDEHQRYATSRKIDAVLLHKVFGLPIFSLLFMGILLFVFQASTPWNHFLDFLINDILYNYIACIVQMLPEVVQRLCLDGILSGVGGILVFIPLMGFLYFALAIVEESGYMSRIAFLLDRMMKSMHLSGKSFVSLLLGFGCNVPAIYSTRTLDNEPQKKLTALLIPFMSCGARLPVYVLFAAAFFPHKAGLMILTMYGIGILTALIMAFVYTKISDYKDEEMFVLELPPYRLPKISIVFHKAIQEVKGYIKKATGIVLWAMMIVWALSYFPSGNLQESYIAKFGKVVAPIFEPLGFGNRWECVAALPGGIIAKETIVGFFETVSHAQQVNRVETINIQKDMKRIVKEGKKALLQSSLFFISPQFELEAESDTQVKRIQALWSDDKANLKAFSFMVYVLLSIPCIMSLQALYHEFGKKLVALSILSMFLIPYIVSLFIYQFFSMF